MPVIIDKTHSYREVTRVAKSGTIKQPEVSAETETAIRDGKKEFEKALMHCQASLTEPDGNVYRGWAIGLKAGNTTLILTAFCIATQILAPCFMLSWCSRIFKTQTAVFTWDTWRDVVIQFSGNEQPTLMDYWECDEVVKEIQLKILGVLLLSMIQLSNDSTLLRQEMQADKLRKYFCEEYMGAKRMLKKRWMWIDAICNCWTVCLIGWAVLPLLLQETSVAQLVLDSFGFLFITNLDEYAQAIEYGVDIRDFDTLMLTRKEAVCAIQKKAAATGSEDPMETDDKRCGAIFVDMLKTGDILFIIARCINFLLLLLQVPMFLCVKFQPADDGTEADHFRLYFELLSQKCVKYWVPMSVFGFLVFIATKLRAFFATRTLREYRSCLHTALTQADTGLEDTDCLNGQRLGDDSAGSAHEDDEHSHAQYGSLDDLFFVDPHKIVISKDIIAFVFFVVFRRGDPRLPATLMTSPCDDSETSYVTDDDEE